MSDQHPPPYGGGSQQPPYQPPPSGENHPSSGGGYPPPPPTSGGGYPPPPPTSGGGFPPPPPTSGGGYPPPPPTSGGGFPPPPPGGQDPYGSQPGGHDPYGSQPGQPGYDPNQPGYDPNQQQPFGAAPGAPLPPMTPPSGRRGGPLKIILAIVGALLLLCCIGGIVLAVQGTDIFGGNPSNAKAGDCLSGKSIDEQSDRFQEADLEVVDCGDSDAKYKVVGRVDDKTQAEATDEVCRPFSDAELIYWQGRRGEEGTVLCLKKNQ